MTTYAGPHGPLRRCAAPGCVTLTPRQRCYFHAQRCDPELGRQWYCRRCGEWWPVGAEFWDSAGHCRACRQPWDAARQRRRRAAA